MTVDADLFVDNLPGLYRDQDTSGQLRQFLAILAGPLAELYDSITQLRDDETVVACRAPFIPLIGALVGTEVDTSLPERAQRDQVRDAISGYRDKGTADLVHSVAESVTGWRVQLVDFSGRVAVVPDVATLVPGPGGVAAQVVSVADPAVLARLGRADDPVPAVLDLRAPRAVTDPVGRGHFDNLGVFVTPARVTVDQRPKPLPAGSGNGRFGFDVRPPDPADAVGVRLQLLDGLDGAPLTRSLLDGQEALFAGTPRGFAIRVADVDVTDPAFQPAVRIVAADLSDFTRPRRPGGAALTLAPTDIAVDPQSGRFLLDPAALGVSEENIRVDYLTALATAVDDAPAPPPSARLPEVRACPVAELVDGFDGTPIRVAVRLGVPLSAFHGTDRGWRVRVAGAEVTSQLTPVLADLGDLTVPAAAGQLAVDPERGLLRFPPGFVTAADLVTVAFSHPDRAAQAQRFGSLAQRLPKIVPAGVVPVVVDTRRPIVGR